MHLKRVLICILSSSFCCFICFSFQSTFCQNSKSMPNISNPFLWCLRGFTNYLWLYYMYCYWLSLGKEPQGIWNSCSLHFVHNVNANLLTKYFIAISVVDVCIDMIIIVLGLMDALDPTILANLHYSCLYWLLDW